LKQSLAYPKGTAGWRASLTDFEKFYAAEFPGAANPHQHQDGRARSIVAQLASCDADVGSNPIGIELFCTQDRGLPDVRFCSDDAARESDQFAWDDQRIKVSLPAVPDSLIQLSQKGSGCLINRRRGPGCRFSANSSCPRS